MQLFEMIGLNLDGVTLGIDYTSLGVLLEIFQEINKALETKYSVVYLHKYFHIVPEDVKEEGYEIDEVIFVLKRIIIINITKREMNGKSKNLLFPKHGFMLKNSKLVLSSLLLVSNTELKGKRIK